METAQAEKNARLDIDLRDRTAGGVQAMGARDMVPTLEESTRNTDDLFRGVGDRTS